MFEYGYAIGTGRAIWPLVEEGVAKGARVYDTIRTLTTVGYSGFKNSQTIYTRIKKKEPWERKPKFPLPERLGKDHTRDAVGLLYLQNIQDNEPSIKITEVLSSIQMGKIVDNPAEVPFRPLSWYLNSLRRSYAVIVHLGNERAEGYELHCAKCALVSGLALSLGRRLLILGEDVSFPPIDYHDIVRSYNSADQAKEITSEFLEPISHIIFDFRKYFQWDIGSPKPRKVTKENILKDIDLGDYAADNEEQSITEVFVETPQYLMALNPTFRVFIGRRGTGKTANFFMVLDRLLQDKRNIVCKIKPESWQLDEFVSFIKTQLDKAKKGYLFQSLWKYMLYSEVIKSCYEKIMVTPFYGSLSRAENNLKEYVEDRAVISDFSFTSRLIHVVSRICSEFDREKTAEVAVSEILHAEVINEMHKHLLDYMEVKKGSCAIVLDSLDANWRLDEDYKTIAELLLSLIECTQDMWRSCSKGILNRGIDKGLSVAIFLRNDIFKVVREVCREPDKLPFELISWKEINSLLEIVNKRILACLQDYDVGVINWADLLELGFPPEDMKKFLSENILYRPRDYIVFFQRCFYNARSHGASYVTRQDFEAAMNQYSEHAFSSLCAESQPYVPDMERLLCEFMGARKTLPLDDIKSKLEKAGIRKRSIKKTVNYLIESNFLGVKLDGSGYHYPLTPTESLMIAERLWKPKKLFAKPELLRIHNAFHSVLSIK